MNEFSLSDKLKEARLKSFPTRSVEMNLARPFQGRGNGNSRAHRAAMHEGGFNRRYETRTGTQRDAGVETPG